MEGVGNLAEQAGPVPELDWRQHRPWLARRARAARIAVTSPSEPASTITARPSTDGSGVPRDAKRARGPRQRNGQATRVELHWSMSRRPSFRPSGVRGTATTRPTELPIPTIRQPAVHRSSDCAARRLERLASVVQHQSSVTLLGRCALEPLGTSEKWVVRPRRSSTP